MCRRPSRHSHEKNATSPQSDIESVPRNRDIKKSIFKDWCNSKYANFQGNGASVTEIIASIKEYKRVHYAGSGCMMDDELAILFSSISNVVVSFFS